MPEETHPQLISSSTAMARYKLKLSDLDSLTPVQHEEPDGETIHRYDLDQVIALAERLYRDGGVEASMQATEAPNVQAPDSNADPFPVLSITHTQTSTPVEHCSVPEDADEAEYSPEAEVEDEDEDQDQDQSEGYYYDYEYDEDPNVFDGMSADDADALMVDVFRAAGH